MQSQTRFLNRRFAVELLLPAFTVHNVRAMATVFQRGTHSHRVGVTFLNLTDALYAEFSNAAFFRPEARRGVILSWDMTF